jgi:oligopeptide transport system permease protein
MVPEFHYWWALWPLVLPLVIGVSWGIVAGYFGGRVDSVMMRIVDVLYGLPFIIFIILLMVIFGRNIWLLFGAIGAVEWLTMARIVRGQVLTIKNQEYVLAAQAMGVTNMQMFRKHIFPNILGPIAVYATLTIPQVMLLEAFLSFFRARHSATNEQLGYID